MSEKSFRKDADFPQLLFEHVRDVILVAKQNGIIVAANPWAYKFFNYSAAELIGMNQSLLIDPKDIHGGEEQRDEDVLIETTALTKDQSKIPIEVSIAGFEFKDEWYNVYLLRDITNRRAAEEELYRMANIDPLTQLPNRRFMNKRLEEELNRTERSNKGFSIIMSDIDGFKQFNDNFGHDCGDYILGEIASLLIESVRKQDLVSRWGGEEFLFLLPETNKRGAEKIGEKIRKNIESNNFVYENKSLHITMTFGITECTWGDDIWEQIKKADSALLLGKNKGKNCVIALK